MNQRVSPQLVAICTMPAHIAVMRAMKRLHDENPVRYHRDRPSMKVCPHETQIGVDVGEDGLAVPVMGPCPL